MLILSGAWGSAIARAFRRNGELVFYLVAKCRIHGLRSAQRSFTRDVVDLVHFVNERILSRKIMRNAAFLYAFKSDDARRTGDRDGHRSGHIRTREDIGLGQIDGVLHD